MKKLLALLALSTLALTACGERDTTYDNFAQCLADEEAVFYGAFWCHNCEDQKDMFGDSADLLPYVECAQGGKDANPYLCDQAGVDAYPTWDFPDGTRLQGTQDFETLSDQSACPLPGEESLMVQ